MRRSTLRPERVVKLSARHAEFSGDQREEIGGLREGVFPGREVTLAWDLAALDKVAIRKQDRRFLLIRFDAHPELRQDVGTVEVIGDAPEAFGLALRAIDALRAVKT